jgi:hypothetical protein
LTGLFETLSNCGPILFQHLEWEKKMREWNEERRMRGLGTDDDKFESVSSDKVKIE